MEKTNPNCPHINSGLKPPSTSIWADLQGRDIVKKVRYNKSTGNATRLSLGEETEKASHGEKTWIFHGFGGHIFIGSMGTGIYICLHLSRNLW